MNRQVALLSIKEVLRWEKEIRLGVFAGKLQCWPTDWQLMPRDGFFWPTECVATVATDNKNNNNNTGPNFSVLQVPRYLASVPCGFCYAMLPSSQLILTTSVG